MSRGVVIYCFRKAAYGKLAWNLAVSIKAVSPDIPVALLIDEDAYRGKGALSELADWQLKYFSEIITMKNDDVYEEGKFMPGKAKLSGYKYFPFDKNMIIDADSICIEPLDPLFEICTKKIHAQAVGKFNQDSETWTCQWMPLKGVKETFLLPYKYELFEINSSFMYVEKSPEADDFHSHAIENYHTAQKSDKVRTWGGGFPDELGFNVAFAQLGIDPTFRFQSVISNETSFPVFFSTNFRNDWTFVHDNFFFISFFGDRHFTDKSLQNYYDRLMKGYGDKFGFAHNYKITNLMKEKHVLTK